MVIIQQSPARQPTLQCVSELSHQFLRKNKIILMLHQDNFVVYINRNPENMSKLSSEL